MKRKLVTLLLALSIATISITACGNKTTSNTETTETSTESTEITTEVETADDLYTDGYQSPEELSAQELALKENNETGLFGMTLPGEGTGMKKFQDWARSQGADAANGWTFIYYNGEAAGNQPSYGKYMNPDSPDYGKIFHVGDTLPNGCIFWGTAAEHEDYMRDDVIKNAEEIGEVYTDPETGKIVISIGD